VCRRGTVVLAKGGADGYREMDRRKREARHSCFARQPAPLMAELIELELNCDFK
jgi:hypothetical protein